MAERETVREDQTALDEAALAPSLDTPAAAVVRAAQPRLDPRPAEAARITKALQRVATRDPAPRLDVECRVTGTTRHLRTRPKHRDGDGSEIHLRDTFGTGSAEFASRMLGQVSGATSPKGSLDAEDLNAGLAAVHGIAPQDEAEAMLAVQMVAVHEAAISLLRQAQTAEWMPQAEGCGQLAVKLLRTYTAQMDALARYRRRGEQTVRVEHVHVEAGGQAIVGPVTHYGTGGGGERETDDRAQAQEPGPSRLGLHALPAMRSADEIRDAMPVAGRERQNALPNAWRRQRQRRADR